MRISVLGPLAARRDDADDDLVLGGLRQRAVLARLAVAGGEIVPVERIVDDLWDGEPPPSGVSNLQSYVSNLRRVLRHDDHVVIERVGPGYRLEVEAVELAAQRFEALVAAAAGSPQERVDRLDEALALWRGPALVEFADQAWAEAEASRLDELRLSAIEARFQALLDAGQHGRLVPDLERAVAEHPLREQLTALLVLALYRSGRQADALRAYERTRAHLADELGLDPVPELVALADRVLAQDPELALAPAAPAPAAPAPATPAPVDGTPTPIEAPLPRAAVVGRAADLIGREAELDRLRRAIDAAAGGATRATVVVGEAGVGKTSLVGAAVADAHAAGALVLWGGCAPDHLVAYQPIISALRGLDRETDGSALAALAGRHPVLEQLLGHHPGRAAVDRDAYELYEAVAGLLVDLGVDRPLVLVVDDLHWADRSSFALLDHLLAEDRVPGLAVLGTVRRPAGRPTEDLDRFIAIARRREGTDVLELAGVDADAVATLLDRRGRPVDAAVAAAVHARTGGNPLFVHALSAQADDLTGADPRALPHTVRETLDLRTAELDADDLQVLVTAAAIGAQVDLRLLAEVARTPLDRVLDVVDVGVQAGLLVEDAEDAGVVSFSHALARDALIARSTRTREAQLHLRIADVLEAAPGDVDVAVLAQHLRAAGSLCDPVRGATASLAAASAALDVVAPDAARTWARRALHQLDGSGAEGADDLRWEATSIIARSSRHLGDTDAFRAVLDDLLAEARRSGDAVPLARAAEEAALGTANVGFHFGEVDESLLALLDEARAAIQAAGDHPAEEATVLAWSSIALAGGPPDERQAELAAAAAKAAGRCADRPDVRALSALAERLALPGPSAVEERLAIHEVMLAEAVAAGWTELEVLALVLGVADLLEADRSEDSRRLLEALRSRLGPHHRPGFDTYLHFLDAAYALLAGDLERADELSTLGIAHGEAAHGTNAVQAWGGEQFILAWERGTLPDLAPMTEAMVAELPDLAAWRVGYAATLVAAGDVAAAAEVLDPLLDGDRLLIPEDLLWSTAVSMLGEIAYATGDERLGRAVAEAIEPVEHRVAVSGMGAISLGHLVHHRGLALAAAGDLEAADEALARAIERSDGCGFRTYAARARIARAAVLDRLGRDGTGLRAEGEAMAAALGVATGLTG
ncbi:MAG: BTAD domain-containing putative transcriptional regulator [Acidimicrobiia bacterium]